MKCHDWNSLVIEARPDGWFEVDMDGNIVGAIDGPERARRAVMFNGGVQVSWKDAYGRGSPLGKEIVADPVVAPATAPSTGNRKETSGKDPMACLPIGALTGVAWVFRSGEVKYGVENWREKLPQGDDVRHYIGAALRHLAACQHDHPALDKESGLAHLDHAIASLIIASYHMKKVPT